MRLLVGDADFATDGAIGGSSRRGFGFADIDVATASPHEPSPSSLGSLSVAPNCRFAQRVADCACYELVECADRIVDMRLAIALLGCSPVARLDRPRTDRSVHQHTVLIELGRTESKLEPSVALAEIEHRWRRAPPCKTEPVGLG